MTQRWACNKRQKNRQRKDRDNVRKQGGRNLSGGLRGHNFSLESEQIIDILYKFYLILLNYLKFDIKLLY